MTRVEIIQGGLGGDSAAQMFFSATDVICGGWTDPVQRVREYSKLGGFLSEAGRARREWPEMVRIAPVMARGPHGSVAIEVDETGCRVIIRLESRHTADAVLWAIADAAVRDPS